MPNTGKPMDYPKVGPSVAKTQGGTPKPSGGQHKSKAASVPHSPKSKNYDPASTSYRK